ncbi:MAG TPA: biopolymer transporter Tol, partial [Bacteroidota bacterium]|nr:biopolymer transporter Tol [Bacteroidota bacterium]
MKQSKSDRARTHRRFVVATVVFFLPVALAFAQQEVYHPELEWKTIETEHFLVHYHEGAERTGRVVAKIAEEIYHPITSLYNHEPDQKVSFIIKDYDDYSNGAAYFYDNKVEIWAPSMDFDFRGTHNWLRNVITHEFTHIVQIQTAMKFGRRMPAVYLQWLGYEAERRPDVLYGYPNVIASYPMSGFLVPAWFAEGVAQYNRPQLRYDFWDSHRDMILRSYALRDSMLTWHQMGVFGKTSLGNESSYNAGFAFVHYIAQKYGIGKLNEIS